MNAWYRELVRAHVLQRGHRASQFNAHLQEVRQYEQMLTDEGIVLLKFWIHLSQAPTRSSGCATSNPTRRRAGA